MLIKKGPIFLGPIFFGTNFLGSNFMGPNLLRQTDDLFKGSFINDVRF